MGHAETVKCFIDHYRKVIEYFVVPLPLLDCMPDFNEKVHLQISKEADNQPKQVELFLKELERSANETTIPSFLDALNGSDDQKFLYPALSGELEEKDCEAFFSHVEEFPKIKKLFQLIKPQLDVLDANLCITTLSPWLSDGERDLLHAKCRSIGNNYTIWWIFFFVNRKEPEWIKEFHNHVKECNYSNPTEGSLAKLLMRYFDLGEDEEQAFTEKEQTLSQPSGDLLDSQRNEEIVLNITLQEAGDAADVKSGNNLPHVLMNDLDRSNQASDDSENIQSSSIPTAAAMNGKVQENKPMELRNYQKELVKLANERKNVIICAPPAAGKTIVAANIVKTYLDKYFNTRKPVLFFTPGGALAQQQKERLESYLNSDFTVDYYCGNTEKNTLDKITVDVVVLTPQILLNALKLKAEETKVTSLSQFELIIFDECHHCMKGHPYNAVMRQYFFLKRSVAENPDLQLPQVVGLTATLGVGKNPDRADKEILKLCANLDAIDGLVTVRDPDNIRELRKYVPHPEEETIHLNPKDKDPFFLKVVSLMEKFEDFLRATGACQNIPKFADTENKRQAYKTWCVSSRNEIAQGKFEKGRDAISCVEYLEVCNDVLDLHSKCRVIDAVKHLNKFMEMTVPATFNEVEKQLFHLLEDASQDLLNLKDDEKCANEYLKEIEKLILNRFAKDPNSKGMLMVQKRTYTSSLKDWMHETESLKFLNAEVFTGVGSNPNPTATGQYNLRRCFRDPKIDILISNSSDVFLFLISLKYLKLERKSSTKCLTHAQQSDIMKLFREGDIKMLICTPDSAGEGMDIVDCSIVINYDYLRSEIATVQIKGRVRKSGGEMHQLSSAKVAHREQLNMQRTVIMGKATVRIQSMIESKKETYLKELAGCQQESVFQDRLALLKKLRNPPRTRDNEFQLQCRKCRVNVCSSFDIRIVEYTQHTNPTDEFKEKYRTIDHPRIRPMGPDWRKKSKVLCKKCGNDWGIEAEWKGCITLPLVKIEGFGIVLKGSSNGKVFTPRKWKSTPFAPISANMSDMIAQLDTSEEAD